KAAYYEIYFLDRALDVTERNEALVADFARLTSVRYGVGQGTQPDVLNAQVERTGLEDRLVQLRQQRVSALARLNALLGRPTGAPLPETELPELVRAAASVYSAAAAPTFASTAVDREEGATVGGRSVADLQQLALEHNPMIQAHRRRIEAQRRAVALAGKAKLPDVQVSAGYGYRAGAGDVLSFNVSVPVPIFAARKQDRHVDEAAATLAEYEAQYDGIVNELNAEIARFVADIERARSQLVLLRDGILPQARASLASATSAYRVGSVDFLTLLDAQVKLYRHELDHHRLLADFAMNVAALERAVGTEARRSFAGSCFSAPAQASRRSPLSSPSHSEAETRAPRLARSRCRRWRAWPRTERRRCPWMNRSVFPPRTSARSASRSARPRCGRCVRRFARPGS